MFTYIIEVEGILLSNVIQLFKCSLHYTSKKFYNLMLCCALHTNIPNQWKTQGLAFNLWAHD